jgi:hypothetical protein
MWCLMLMLVDWSRLGYLNERAKSEAGYLVDLKSDSDSVSEIMMGRGLSGSFFTMSNW